MWVLCMWSSHRFNTFFSVLLVALCCVTPAFATTFTTPLQVGTTHPEVKLLQQFLNAHHFTITPSGPGSPGNETEKFGALTKSALARFQEAYASDILTPVGLTHGTGYFGPSTLKKVNELLAGQATPSTPTPPTQASAPTLPTASYLTRKDYDYLLKRIETERKNTEHLSDRVEYTSPIESLTGISLTDSTLSGGTASLAQITVSGNTALATLTVSATTTFGSPLIISHGSAPSVTGNTLYNVGGDLYWAGNVIGGATTGQWNTDGANVWREGGNVGIGTTSPYAKFSVAGQAVAEYFTATVSTATSTLPRLATTNLLLGNDYVTDLTGTGLELNAGALSVATNTLNLAISDTTGTLTVNRGGTGASTLSGLLQGNGTGAFTTIANVSTIGQILRVTGASTYAWGALDLGDADAVTGVLADGYFTKTGDWSGTLGGVASSSFLRSDQVDTATGLITFTEGILSLASSTFTGGLQAGGSTGLHVLSGGGIGIGSDSIGGARMKVTNASMSIVDEYDTDARVASFFGVGIVSGQIVLNNDGICGSYNVIGANNIVYGTVLGEDGNCWLDRNLGASRVALSSTDSSSYGYYYQWGRATDGHQISSSITTGTLSAVDDPGHGNFILAPASPYDWRDPQNNTLWQGVSGTNNPCPAGFRLPTQAQMATYVTVAGITNSATAYSADLKLPAAGYRNRASGAMNLVGSYGSYWSSSVTGTYAYYLYVHGSGVNPANTNYRAFGFSVRCVKD